MLVVVVVVVVVASPGLLLEPGSMAVTVVVGWERVVVVVDCELERVGKRRTTRGWGGGGVGGGEGALEFGGSVGRGPVPADVADLVVLVVPGSSAPGTDDTGTSGTSTDPGGLSTISISAREPAGGRTADGVGWVTGDAAEPTIRFEGTPSP